MPVKPRPSNRDDQTVHLQIRIPGWLKNQILTAANNAGEPLNRYVAAILHEAVNKPPVEACAGRTVSVGDVIADYLSGTSTLAPCGRVWPCDGTGVEPTRLNGAEFCRVCNVRL
jgi:hypothetical protein